MGDPKTLFRTRDVNTFNANIKLDPAQRRPVCSDKTRETNFKIRGARTMVSSEITIILWHVFLQLPLSKLIFADLLQNYLEFASLVTDESNANIFDIFIYPEMTENIGYFRMVHVMKDLIAAVRIGQWDLHFHMKKEMIP